VSTIGWLKSQGLTNEGAPSYGEITNRGKVSLGRCNGTVSTIVGTNTKGNPKRKVVRCRFETTDTHKDKCPRCGYFLKWVQIKAREIEQKTVKA